MKDVVKSHMKDKTTNEYKKKQMKIRMVECGARVA